MNYLVKEKLGPSQSVTHEGFLVIEGVPLARTGEQVYWEGEIPLKGDSSGRIVIERDPEEVFRKETIASLNGKAVTIDHPDENVVPENWRDLAVGHVINPRQGEGVLDHLLLADLFITHPAAIDSIRNGNIREVSVGYDAEYEPIGDSAGRGRQRNIVANHLALVKAGRCGPVCSIHDRKPRRSLNGTIDSLESVVNRSKRIKRAVHVHFHL